MKEKMNKTITKTLTGLLSWSIYSLVACILLGIAEPDLTVRQYVGYSFMFGLLIGSINNLERVIREEYCSNIDHNINEEIENIQKHIDECKQKMIEITGITKERLNK